MGAVRGQACCRLRSAGTTAGTTWCGCSRCSRASWRPTSSSRCTSAPSASTCSRACSHPTPANESASLRSCSILGALPGAALLCIRFSCTSGEQSSSVLDINLLLPRMCTAHNLPSPVVSSLLPSTCVCRNVLMSVPLAFALPCESAAPPPGSSAAHVRHMPADVLVVALGALGPAAWLLSRGKQGTW